MKGACGLAEHGTDDIGVHQLEPIANVDRADELVDEANTRCAVCPDSWSSCSGADRVRDEQEDVHSVTDDATRVIPPHIPAGGPRSGPP